jgi:putative ABC transport system permease protein
MSGPAQFGAVAGLGLRSLPRRPWSSATTVVAIALVVLVLLAFLSIGEGFRRTLESSGSPGVAVITRDDSLGSGGTALGRDELSALATAPGIRAAADGEPAISPEMVIPVTAPTIKGAEANLSVRGVDFASPIALAGFEFVAGRRPRAATNEIAVGRSAAGEFAGLDVGRQVELGGHVWTVAGHFDARGSAYESEVRADLNLLRTLFNRGPTAQIVRAKLESEQSLADLQAFLRSQPQLRLKAQTERAYFLRAGRSGEFIQRLGWPLAIIMAIGALCGAANTMSSSTAARAREMGTLRAVGFQRLPIFAGVMVESLVLALLGALLGIAVAWSLFDGVRGSTLGSSLGQLVFEYRMSPPLALKAAILALLIGALGGAGPAWHAARRPLRDISGE